MCVCVCLCRKYVCTTRLLRRYSFSTAFVRYSCRRLTTEIERYGARRHVGLWRLPGRYIRAFGPTHCQSDERDRSGLQGMMRFFSAATYGQTDGVTMLSSVSYMSHKQRLINIVSIWLCEHCQSHLPVYHTVAY